MKIKYSLFFIVVCLALFSCDADKIYENNVAVPTTGWRGAEPARFEVDITDTESPCNIYINVRNNQNYKYRNLWLFFEIHSPSGAVERDTIEIILADHRGKWLGHGLGSKFDSRIFLRRNMRFAVAGKYIFNYEQAMRDEPLTGIDDIGLRIEFSY